MMKIFAVLLATVICGCASQEPETSQEPVNVQVFYDEPKIEYEDLGRINSTNRAKDPLAALGKTLERAAEMGANGVIVHSITNKGLGAGGRDSFATGGGGATIVYQIQATAIRYVE